MSANRLAFLLQVSPRQARRWLEHGIPARWRALYAQINGDVGAIHPAWSGFVLDPRDGLLWTPNGECVTPGDIVALPLLRQLAQEREREHARQGGARELPSARTSAVS